MPTVFTHALAGGVLSQAAPSGPSRWKVPVALAVLAVMPDLDAVGFLLGIPYGHFFGHRGFSHSILFAGITSFLVLLLFFREPKRFSKDWWRLFLIALLASTSHGLFDAATDAGLGIGLLMPFNNERIFFAFRPLRTSAIGPAAFLNYRSLAVLWSEIIWIWLPLLSITFVYQIGKYLFNEKKERTAFENE